MPGSKVIFLTPDDKAFLQRLRKAEADRPRNNHHFLDLKDPYPAQDVYIAKLPTGPGIVLAGMNQTTLVPGEAICAVYLLNQATEIVEAVVNPDATPFNLTVYNPHSNPYFGFTKYIRITREKGGAWICDKPPTHYRAKLISNLLQGATSTVKVYYRGSTAWVDSGEVETVREFSLNLDEMYVANQKGWIEWDEGGVWVFDSTACPVADNTGLV